MTDREMLEIAARAAGMEEDMRYPGSFYSCDGMAWRPRQDDGDALRLGATIGMNLYINKRYCIAEVLSDGDGPAIAIKEYVSDGDTLAALRLAIVRAAAEIGAQL